MASVFKREGAGRANRWYAKIKVGRDYKVIRLPAVYAGPDAIKKDKALHLAVDAEILANKSIGVGVEEMEAQYFVRKVKNANDVIMAAHSDFVRAVTLPSFGEVHAEAKRLASIGYKNKSGMVCVYDEHVESAPDLAIQANYFACSDFKKEREYVTAKTVKGEEFSSRRYTTFSLCYSWIRSLMKVNGEKIVGIDCTALHPNIIAAECEKRGIKCAFLKGDTHAKVAELLHINRDEAKQINLMFFNWDKSSFVPGPRGILLRKFRDFMERDHKDVLETIEELNKMYSFLDYKGIEVEGHANLSRLLFAEESLIMGEVIRQLRMLGITCNQSYDAVFVPESKKAIAVAIFNEVLGERGVGTMAK